jgi:hypothetical protein
MFFSAPKKLHGGALRHGAHATRCSCGDAGNAQQAKLFCEVRGVTVDCRKKKRITGEGDSA